MFLNIFISFNFYYILSSYLEVESYSNKNINSINILINSSLIVLGTSLYLTNFITENNLLRIFHSSLGFYINDLYYSKYTIKEFTIKLIHHFIGFMGILSFNSYKIEIARLFQTEISNIPFQIRNILYNKKKKHPILNTILIIIFYILFLYQRIIQGYDNRNVICGKNNKRDCILVSGIYLLWIYWFILINIKVSKIIIFMYQNILHFY